MNLSYPRAGIVFMSAMKPRSIGSVRSLCRILALISPVVIVIAGCGGTLSPSANPDNGTLTISPAIARMDTNCNGCNSTGSQQFKATLNSNGTAAAVTWSLTGGDPNAGPGSIDDAGFYTPPSYLSEDSVPVKVIATLQSDKSNSVSAVATVTPGFLQPLTPENATVAAGSSLTINGAIAEIGAGIIHWALSTSPTRVNAPGAGFGTLTASPCERSSRSYTNCVVTYTAPQTTPAITALYVVGTVNRDTYVQPLHIVLSSTGVNSSGLINQAVQTGAIALGSSGGNDGDFDTATTSADQQYVSDCCGGTLGSLIEDSNSNFYILSNNHVLAESDQATVGSSIDQPGMIEDGCVPYGQTGSGVRPVATLSSYVPLANANANVDAAIARIATGSVDPTGGILQFGSLGANGVLVAAPPAGGTGEAVTPYNVAGMQVAKSGRTTGLTCSAISAINLNIIVDYYKDCAETIPYYTKTYTNQIGISGSDFSDSGDSGSLVVDAANAEPVGLFFAGNEGLSIANPIADVLAALSTQAGTNFSFPANPTHPVSCLNFEQNTVAPASKRAVSTEAFAIAQTVANVTGAALVNQKVGILGVSAGHSLDSPGEATVIVYTDRSKPNVTVPVTIGGLRTQPIPTDARTLAFGIAPTTQSVAENITLPANLLTAAVAVKEQNWRQIMKDPAFFGVGVTQSQDNPNEAALLVLVDSRVDSKTKPETLPATVGGLRVRYMYLDRLHVSKSKYAGSIHPSACAIKSILKAKSSDDLDLSKPTSLDLQ